MSLRTVGLAVAAGLSGLLATACTEYSDFDAAASEADLVEAFETTGMQVCGEETVDWNIAGFDAGRRYQVASDCTALDDDGSARQLDVLAARFDSESSRDQAHRASTTVVRPLRNASVWTYGPYLLVLEGEKDASDYDKLVSALEDVGAK